MPDIKIAFYKATHDNATIVDKLIAWWTKGPYSHVETLIKEDGKWYMYSTTPKEGKFRKKPHTINYEYWDYVDVSITDDQLRILKLFFNKIIGAKYDWLGILGFILPFRDREHNWFCSETSSNGLKIIGHEAFMLIEPSRISPNREAKLLGLDIRPVYTIKNVLKKFIRQIW